MRKFLAGVLVALLSLPFAASAQQPETLELPDNADIRIIVDISGSMKANDPDNLRQPAVRLLARMLPEGARAGVWTFGQYVNMLVPHGEVTDAWRDQAIADSEKINSVALRTNLGEALRVASDRYHLGSDRLDNTDFILLTDGKVDISEDASANERERRRILGEQLDQLTGRGATVHTVALSSDADTELLETLAETTGGSHTLAPSADALTRAFLSALNTAVPQQQIPIEEDGFRVDEGVEEFTALIFRADEAPSATRELGLVSPDGEEATADSVPEGMRWVRETEYDLITVTEPSAGEWRIDGELGDGSRVTVVSDLRMVVSPIPPRFTEDEPVSVRVAFFEGEDKVDNADFLSVLEVRLTLTSEDGRAGTKVLSADQPPADGVYTDNIPRLPDAGEYELDIVADGQTFSRRFSTVTRFVLPEGEEPAAAAEPEAEAKPVETVEQVEVEPQAEPEPETQEPEQAVEEAGPIDVSQVEEPEPEPATAGEETGAIPMWMMATAGGLGVLIMAGAGFLVMRRRKSAQAQEEPPVVAPDESGQAREPEEAEQPEQPEEIPVAEPEPEEELQGEPEEEPEKEPEDELPEDDIPVADAEVQEDEPLPEPEPEPEPEEEDDEFGLEDFDLSEFDDLPDTDEEKGLLDDEDESKDGEDDTKKDR